MNMSDEFTKPQLGTLDEIARNRLTVVRAGPGSGKTRVFVEALRRELSRWTSKGTGVAALSFTNVAHEVISERLGGTPGGPHFVGTLDSFLWRFVVRPFGHLVGLAEGGPTLIPSPLDEMLSGPQQKFGPEKWHTGSIFKVVFIGGAEDNPELFHRGEGLRIGPPYRDWNLGSKRKEWRSRGRLTHSDSQYVASCILKGTHGPHIVELVARRFPVILVDEFQDTGWFLSRALLALLGSPGVRGAVVGDPDQAIYGFGGAHRGLFGDAEKIAGRPACVLDESHRCRPKVAAVATALSRSGKKVIARETKSEGRAILLVHTQDTPALDPILAKLSETIGAHEIPVLARKVRTVEQLARTTSEHTCPWTTGVGRRMTRAVEHLLAHEPALAARIVRRELGELLLDDETPTSEAIEKAGLPLAVWRSACHAVLMEAASAVEGETWNAWIARVKKHVGKEAERLGRPIEGKTLGARFKKATTGGDGPRGSLGSSSPGTKQTVITVHQAKGREFDGVLYYVPKPHKGHSPCPSDEWWSPSPSSEEREIAFVACSRARNLLVLAVHKNTHDALQAKQRVFYDYFEVHELGVTAATRSSTKRKNA